MINKSLLWLILIVFLAVNAVSAQTNAELRIAPLNFKTKTLPNGLKVIALEDHSSPTVAIQVLYRVGSKDDPEGRSGFAHLFEHMMFKSTKNLKNEQFDRLTEDIGGFNNASTSDDYTNYYEVVPSNYLETLLWAEAERMANLNVDEANFKSERDVVKEEFRQRILAQPYGRLFYSITKNSYVAHPYRRPTIGSIEELEAAKIDDVRSFYNLFYRPDNAILVVVGDFEPNQLNNWIDRYFGRIQPNKAAIPRVSTTEPERTAEKRITEYAPNVPLSAVAVSFLAPPTNSSDVAALRVAEAILSGGASSRLYQELVYKQQIAQEAAIIFNTLADKGTFTFFAIVASGKKPADVEKALIAEIKKLQASPPTSQEVEKAKNGLVTRALSERETSNGKAFILAYAELIYGNATEANNELEKLQKVSAVDVQNAVKKYFLDSNQIVFNYYDESARQGEQKNAK